MPAPLVALGAGALIPKLANAVGGNGSSNMSIGQISPMMQRYMMLTSHDPAATMQSIQEMKYLPGKIQFAQDYAAGKIPQDQLASRLMQADPMQWANILASQAATPMKNYTVDGGPARIMNGMSALNLMATGHTVASTGDANQPTGGTGTAVTYGPDGSYRIGKIPGYNEAIQSEAQAKAAGTGAGNLQYAGPIAAAEAWGRAPAELWQGNSKTYFENAFKPTTLPNPNNPNQNVTVSTNVVPNLLGAQMPGLVWNNFNPNGGGAGKNSGAPNSYGGTGLNSGQDGGTGISPQKPTMPTVGANNGAPPQTPVPSNIGATNVGAGGQQQPGLPAGPSAQGTFEQSAAKDEAALASHMNELDMIDKAAQDVSNSPGLHSVLGVHSYTNPIAMRGGDANDALKKIDFLKNRAILTTFQSARDMSTTGGGVGRLTETELPIFANSQAQLDTSQSPENFKRSLSDLRSNVAAMKQNILSGFQKQYGRSLQYQTPQATAANNNAQAIVDELRRRGVIK